jgi:hypothetical protein
MHLLDFTNGYGKLTDVPTVVIKVFLKLIAERRTGSAELFVT